MAGEKRKGKEKVVPKRKKGKADKEWERILRVPDTQGQPQKGIRIGESVQGSAEVQGEQQVEQPLRRSGRTRQPKAAVTPSPAQCSGPRTRGGSVQRPAQQRVSPVVQREHDSDTDEEGGRIRGTRAEAFGAYLRDLRSLPGPKVKKLRCMTISEWFTPSRDHNVDPRFWTLLQESFHASYTRGGSQPSTHRMLQWTALRTAAGGIPILPHFEYITGLPALLSERSRYVPDWVRVFYATVHIDSERLSIRFMFMGEQWQLSWYSRGRRVTSRVVLSRH